MVDIHSHILPGVDDGAPRVEVALAMCRMAAADGIRHLVATPHANDEYTYDREGHQQRQTRGIGRRQQSELGTRPVPERGQRPRGIRPLAVDASGSASCGIPVRQSAAWLT